MGQFTRSGERTGRGRRKWGNLVGLGRGTGRGRGRRKWDNRPFPARGKYAQNSISGRSNYFRYVLG